MIRDLNNRINFFIIVGIFLVSVIIRFYLSQLTAAPIVFGDELLWSKLAESFHNQLNTDFRGNYFITQNILYPIIISVAYFFNDSSMIYLTIKLINCFLMSAVVFPIFLLSRRIFDNRWLVFFLVIISVSIPEMFQTALIMQESLFYLIIVVTIYFIFIEFENPSNFSTITWNLFISFLLFLCYFTKAIGLALFLSYLLYTILSYFIFKRNKLKEVALKVLYISISFASYYYLTKLSIEFVNGFPDISDLYMQKFHFQFNIDFLMKAATGLVLISFYTIIAFMILPVIVSISSISKQHSAINQLSIFILLSTIISIVIIDFMIFVLETSSIYEIRVHIRYLFVYFIFYLIACAYQLYNKNENLVNLFFIVLSVLFAALSSFILEKYKLVNAMLYVDAMMLSYFNLYYKYDVFKLLFNIGIIISLTIFVYWQIKRKFRQTLIFTLASVFIISLIGNFTMYSLYSSNYKNIGSGFGSNELRKEINSISNFLNEKNKEKSVKVLLMPRTEAKMDGGDGFRIDSLESMLNVNYSFLPFLEGLNAPFTDGVFNLENFYPFGYKYTNSPKVPIGKIDYVITTVENVIFEHLNLVSIDGVGKFYRVYKVDNENGTFAVAQMIINRHVDLWNDGIVKIRIYSNKQHINVDLNLNATDNPTNPTIKISDSTGHLESTIVKKTGSIYSFEANKNQQDQFFEISIESNDSFVPKTIIPNSVDTRELSFRLLDVKIKKD
ncbi:hypothetical protein [Paenibacillus sp. WC2504]|uniref:hypothetical protein n=1 Tax=Paenibacillus sp. WC2504 TaxID=3461403 RepID=UPI004045AACF